MCNIGHSAAQSDAPWPFRSRPCLRQGGAPRRSTTCWAPSPRGSSARSSAPGPRVARACSWPCSPGPRPAAGSPPHAARRSPLAGPRAPLPRPCSTPGRGGVDSLMAAMRRIGCLLARDEALPLQEAKQRALLAVALTHSPRVESAGVGLAYLDVAGLRGLFGEEREIGERLFRAAAD